MTSFSPNHRSLNVALFVLSCISMLAIPGAVIAGHKETEVSVVARLYKDFAWQAIANTDKKTRMAFGDEFSQQSVAILDEYLDPTLAALLVRDAHCAARTHEICNLDFDPLFASQDANASDLAIDLLAPGRVAAAFKYPSNGEAIQLEFKVSNIGGKWRITDIIYQNMEGASLREILTRKMRR